MCGSTLARYASSFPVFVMQTLPILPKSPNPAKI